MSSEHEERLTEFGIPVDAVKGVVAEQFAAAVQGAAAVQASPQGAWLTRHQRELEPYLRANPELADAVGKMSQASPLGAVDYLRLKFESEGPAARRDMRTTLLPMGGPRTHDLPASQEAAPPAGWPQSRDVESARERFRLTGSRRDAEAFARARLDQVIPDSHFWP